MVHRISLSQTRSTTSSIPSADDDHDEDSRTQSSTSSQMTIEDSFDFINSFRDSGNRAELYTNAISTWIAKDMVAANLIANDGFKKMFQMISPRYHVPHPNTIKRKIDRKFQSAKVFITDKLNKFPFISLTADSWTHQFTNNQYLGVTAHGFDGQSLESFCIACMKFDESHTAGNICSLFESIIDSWAIERGKIVACVTDNARNIVNAVDLFLGHGKHASCFAHSLNLVVKKAIKDCPEIFDMIQSIKDIVTFFHHSPKATMLLNSLQDSSLKLIQDVPTRWNSTFSMLERFLLLKEHVSVALSQLETPKDMIPNSTLKILEEVRIVLKPFLDVTNRLSSASNPSISQIIPLTNLLKIALTDLKINHREAKDLASKLVNELNQRFDRVEHEEIYSKATILDPRFKNNDFLSPSAAASAIKKIDDYLKTFQPSRPTTRAAASNSRVVPDINNILSFRKIYQKQPSSNLSLEFRNYLDAPLLPWETSPNPFLFWTNNFNSESELPKLALKYLIIPATSVPSERLFSKAGDILKKRRSTLSPKRVEQLLIMSCLSSDLISSF